MWLGAAPQHSSWVRERRGARESGRPDEPQHSPQPHAALTPLLSDDTNDLTARRTLKAAARQSFNLEAARSTYRVHARGSIAWTGVRPTCAGVTSPRRLTFAQEILADVSFLGDRPGHSKASPPQMCSSPTGRSITGALPVIASASASSPRAPLDGAKVASPREPSSRVEAIRTARKLNASLESLGKGVCPNNGWSDLGTELAAWDAAFGDVTRQVTAHCAERGHLLNAIHVRYATALRRLLKATADHAESMREEERSGFARQMAGQDKTAHAAVLFTRAMHVAVKEAAAEATAAEVSSRIRSLENNADEAARSRARCHAAQQERDAAVATAEELQAELDEQCEPHAIYANLIRLKARLEAGVLCRALTRFGCPLDAVLAATPELEVALPLIQGPEDAAVGHGAPAAAGGAQYGRVACSRTRGPVRRPSSGGG